MIKSNYKQIRDEMRLRNATHFTLNKFSKTFKDLARYDKEQHLNFIQAFLVLIAVGFAMYVLLDMFSFMMWIISGQFPVDNWYLGSLTANVLGLIIK